MIEDREKLQSIFEDDPYNLLEIKRRASPAETELERLKSTFDEITTFYKEQGREPSSSSDINEHRLYARLKGIRENKEKAVILKAIDSEGLLDLEQIEINTIDDVFKDDDLGIFDQGAEDIFTFKHVPKEKSAADYTANRKPCENFNEYEKLFSTCHAELKNGKRKMMKFYNRQLTEGAFFVIDGVMALLVKTYDLKIDKMGHKDGRTLTVFENATQSNMKLRSLSKAVLKGGYSISSSSYQTISEFDKNMGKVSDNDKETGLIYVVTSMSEDPKIATIENLYKVGFTKQSLTVRIKDAKDDPTFLMAPVSPHSTYRCYNVNPQKLEHLLHKFFGEACLDIEVTDNSGKKYVPREWFIAPIGIIDQAIQLIITGEIVNYKYDRENQVIMQIV